ncbi:MAG: SDR family oxidoreductase [Flavobacteriaceae bacterium]
MNISFEGKKALVGGASGGIGLAIARQLAKSGAEITLVARNREKLKRYTHELACDHNQQHRYLEVDYTNFESYKQIIRNYFKDHSVDILVNNTQGPAAGGAMEKNIDDYQQAFDLLFKTTVCTTELAVEHMIEKKWGRIINVASVSVKEPLSYLVLSNSIRAAVVTWAKSLAIDVGQYGITVNSILTGFFDTERLGQLNRKKAEKMGVPEHEVTRAMEELTALKRIGNPIEYGYLAAFLASDQAAFITGTSIPIDGGYLKSL